MDFLLGTEQGRVLLLILAGVGFLLQIDNLIDAVRGATKKGGDSPSDEEEPSPPEDE